MAYSRFILSQDGRAVIPLLGWFRSKIASAESNFNHHLYHENNQMVPLTPQELNAIKRSLMPYSADFFGEVELRDASLVARGTLSAAMKEMITHL